MFKHKQKHTDMHISAILSWAYVYADDVESSRQTHHVSKNRQMQGTAHHHSSADV